MLKEIKNTAVSLPTQKEYNEYMRMCKDAGLDYRAGNKQTKTKKYWEHLKENTCVEVKDRFGYASKTYFKSRGYKIITLKELKTIMKNQTYKEGDLIYDEYSKQYRRILGVCGKGVLVSFSWEKGTQESISSTTLAIAELEKNGWKVVPESHLTEEPTVTVGGKKYKKSDIDALQPIAE